MTVAGQDERVPAAPRSSRAPALSAEEQAVAKRLSGGFGSGGLRRLLSVRP